MLLIKQFVHKDVWGIPKGHVHADETHEQCALREVREEAGITISLGQALPEVETTFKNYHKRVVSFLAEQVGSDEPNCTDPECEVADVKWFGFDELPRLVVYQRSLISHVQELLLRS